MCSIVSPRPVGFNTQSIVVPSVIYVAGTHHTQVPLNPSVMVCHNLKRTPVWEFNLIACPPNPAYWEPLTQAEDWTWALQVAIMHSLLFPETKTA